MLTKGQSTRRVPLVVALSLAATLACSSPAPRGPGPPAADGDRALARAFEEGSSNIRVEGEGVVTTLLPDDRNGRRHQRFILELGSGQTVLVAHNVDLAPRIEALREGDRVAFSGEYEWNPRGGVIHWTHRDPGGAREAGWLRHAGRTYQ